MIYALHLILMFSITWALLDHFLAAGGQEEGDEYGEEFEHGGLVLIVTVSI